MKGHPDLTQLINKIFSCFLAYLEISFIPLVLAFVLVTSKTFKKGSKQQKCNKPTTTSTTLTSTITTKQKSFNHLLYFFYGIFMFCKQTKLSSTFLVFFFRPVFRRLFSFSLLDLLPWVYTNVCVCASFWYLQRKTFAVSHHGKSGGLTLDWQTGFALAEGADSAIVWQYKFSQLRGSSDDGKSKLKLHFQDHETRAIETKVSTKYRYDY